MVGLGILLLVLGIVLWLTVMPVIGWILMVVGAIGVLLSLIFWSSWGGFGGRRTVVREDY